MIKFDAQFVVIDGIIFYTRSCRKLILSSFSHNWGMKIAIFAFLHHLSYTFCAKNYLITKIVEYAFSYCSFALQCEYGIHVILYDLSSLYFFWQRKYSSKDLLYLMLKIARFHIIFDHTYRIVLKKMLHSSFLHRE